MSTRDFYGIGGVTFSSTIAPMFDINLLPWRQQRRQKKLRFLVKVVSIGAGVVILGLWVGRFYCEKRARDYAIQNKQLQEDVQVLKQQKEVEIKIRKKNERINSANDLLKKIKLNNKKLFFNLSGFVEKTPKDIRLELLSFSEGTWLINGVAKNQKAVLQWVKKLEDRGLFSEYQFDKWEVEGARVRFSVKEGVK